MLHADDFQVILKYRKGPIATATPAAANNGAINQTMTDAPEAANASNRSAAATSDHDMPDAPPPHTNTAAPIEDSSTAMLPRRSLRTRTVRHTEQMSAPPLLPDAPKPVGNTAAPVEDTSTPSIPRRTLRGGRTARQTAQTSTTAPVENSPPAILPRRTLRSQTVRQTEQTNARPVLPAATRARARRAELPRLTERQYRGKRGGIIELPWVSAPQPYRAPSPTEAELAAAHTSGPSLLGMPPVVFEQIAEYLLIYQQPEELVQKNSHRRMAEVTKAHVLTVSSEKVVRKPTHKQVARNLNTASLTNFFLVCRHFRDVGLKVYYGRNTFKFSSDDNLRGWAAAIPSRRKFVRSIQLDSHWEVGLKGHVIRPENLVMKSDHGFVLTNASRLFPGLERFHLSIGCAAAWQHDAFLKAHGSVPPELEDRWWKFAKDWANKLVDSIKRSRTKSRKVDVSYSLIFDGAFFAGRSNAAGYRQRMKDFVWKISAIDSELPKRPTPKELLPVLPGPLLPNTTAVVVRAPTGAWSQKYVNDPSIDSGSSISGVVFRHQNWSAIMTQLLFPSHLTLAQAKSAMRAHWAAVMTELLSHDPYTYFLEKNERDLCAAVAKLASLERRATIKTQSAVKALWVTVHAELRASFAEKAAVQAEIARKAEWSAVMSELKSSALPAQFLETMTARSAEKARLAAFAEEQLLARIAERAYLAAEKAAWSAIAAEVTSREHKAARKAKPARKSLWPVIFPELKASVAERAKKSAWKAVMFGLLSSDLLSSNLPAKFLASITERDTERARQAAIAEEQLLARIAEKARVAAWAAIAAEVTSSKHKAARKAEPKRKALWPVVFAELRAQIVEMAKVNAAIEEEAMAEAARAAAASERQRVAAAAGQGLQGMRRTLLNSRK